MSDYARKMLGSRGNDGNMTDLGVGDDRKMADMTNSTKYLVLNVYMDRIRSTVWIVQLTSDRQVGGSNPFGSVIVP